jgi:septal ring factor EnvC (AmiA/AmiB activator)
LLNWRGDPDYEQRMSEKLSEIERIKTEILRIEKEILQAEKELEQAEREFAESEKELEPIERETQRLLRDNARRRALLRRVDQLCFPDDFRSTPPPSTESDCDSSWS